MLEEHLDSLFKDMYPWNREELKKKLVMAEEKRLLVHLYHNELKDEDGKFQTYHVDLSMMSPNEYTNYLYCGGVNEFYSPNTPLELLK